MFTCCALRKYYVTCLNNALRIATPTPNPPRENCYSKSFSQRPIIGQVCCTLRLVPLGISSPVLSAPIQRENNGRRFLCRPAMLITCEQITSTIVFFTGKVSTIDETNDCLFTNFDCELSTPQWVTRSMFAACMGESCLHPFIVTRRDAEGTLFRNFSGCSSKFDGNGKREGG